MGLMGAAVSEGTYLQDVLVAEWDQRVSRKVVSLENNSGATVTLQPGEGLRFDTDHYEVCDADDDCAVMLAERVVDLADGAAQNVVVIYQGPVVLNTTRMNFAAAADAATALANLKTSLGACCAYVTEPPAAVKQLGTPV